MTRRQVRVGLAAVAVGAFFAYVCTRGAARGNDFKYPYGAARLLWKSGVLRVDSQPRYPVTFHVLLAPLASRSIATASAVWALLSFAAVAATPRAIERLTGISPGRQWPAWLAVAPFVVDALALGQGDPINLLLVILGLGLAAEGRGMVGAAMIGMAGMIKILPAVQWATLLMRDRSKGVVAGIAVSVVAGIGLVVAAVGPMAGWEAIRQQAGWIAGNEKPWHLVARGGDLRANNESLPIVLARTFCTIPASRRPGDAVVLAGLPLEMAWATWFTILGVVGAGWVVAARAAGRLAPKRGAVAMLALTSVAMLASTPICWHHYFLWLLPAYLFLIDRPRVVLALGAASLAGTAITPLRGVGIHAWMALGVFAMIAARVVREGRLAGEVRETAPGTAGRMAPAAA